MPSAPVLAFNFNPRSPHGERQVDGVHVATKGLFQSTLPARGATFSLPSMACWMMYFNPRSPHGERQCASIRAGCCRTFQSTLPARGATRGRHRGQPPLGISIHAPRTGSDLALDIDDDVDFISIHAPRTGSDLTYSTSPAIRKISIHAPRTGSDTASLLATDGVITFQSTLPARGATSTHDKHQRSE